MSRQPIRGTPARPIHRSDPLCPMCGTHPLDCEAALQLVALMHNLQLMEDGTILPPGNDISQEPTVFVGRDYLPSGASTLRTNISIALKRLLIGVRAHAMSMTEGDPLVIVVCRASEGVDAMSEAISRSRNGMQD